MVNFTKLKYYHPIYSKVTVHIKNDIRKCNIFTPQIKGIHKPCIPHHRDTSCILALLKEQATFIKARISLMWMVCLSSFYTSSDNNRLWE